MQHHAGIQYGQGSMPSNSVQYNNVSELSVPSSSTPSTTATLRQWRKKEAAAMPPPPAAEKQPPEHQQQQIPESQGPIARVAPQAHYPRPTEPYRYPHQYAATDYGLNCKDLSPAPVKYSEIVEPQHPSRLDHHLSPIIHKSKEKDYQDMCSVQQQQQQQQAAAAQMNNMKHAYQNMHATMIPPPPQYKESHLHHPSTAFAPYHGLPNYKMPNQYQRQYSSNDSNFHIPLFNEQFYQMDQRAYHQNQRVYRSQVPPPNYRTPQPYPTAQYNYKPNIPSVQNHDQYRMHTLPHTMQKYPDYKHLESVPTRRIYPENLTNYPAPRVSPSYNQCSQMEYAQHYQNRRQVPAEYLQHDNKAQYLQGHMPDLVTENTPKSSLKQYLESWNDDIAEIQQVGSGKPEGAIARGKDGGSLYVLDSTEISTENVQQFLHLKVDKLPENIKFLAANPSTSVIRSQPGEEAALNLAQDSVIQARTAPKTSVISETKRFLEVETQKHDGPEKNTVIVYNENSTSCSGKDNASGSVIRENKKQSETVPKTCDNLQNKPPPAIFAEPLPIHMPHLDKPSEDRDDLGVIDELVKTTSELLDIPLIPQAEEIKSTPPAATTEEKRKEENAPVIVEGDYVLLQIAGELLEISVTNGEGRKTISVIPYTDCTVCTERNNNNEETTIAKNNQNANEEIPNEENHNTHKNQAKTNKRTFEQSEEIASKSRKSKEETDHESRKRRGSKEETIINRNEETERSIGEHENDKRTGGKEETGTLLSEEIEGSVGEHESRTDKHVRNEEIERAIGELESRRKDEVTNTNLLIEESDCSIVESGSCKRRGSKEGTDEHVGNEEVEHSIHEHETKEETGRNVCSIGEDGSKEEETDHSIDEHFKESERLYSAHSEGGAKEETELLVGRNRENTKLLSDHLIEDKRTDRRERSTRESSNEERSGSRKEETDCSIYEESELLPSRDTAHNKEESERSIDKSRNEEIRGIRTHEETQRAMSETHEEENDRLIRKSRKEDSQACENEEEDTKRLMYEAHKEENNRFPGSEPRKAETGCVISENSPKDLTQTEETRKEETANNRNEEECGLPLLSIFHKEGSEVNVAEETERVLGHQNLKASEPPIEETHQAERESLIEENDDPESIEENPINYDSLTEENETSVDAIAQCEEMHEKTRKGITGCVIADIEETRKVVTTRPIEDTAEETGHQIEEIVDIRKVPIEEIEASHKYRSLNPRHVIEDIEDHKYRPLNPVRKLRLMDHKKRQKEDFRDHSKRLKTTYACEDFEDCGMDLSMAKIDDDNFNDHKSDHFEGCNERTTNKIGDHLHERDPKSFSHRKSDSCDEDDERSSKLEENGGNINVSEDLTKSSEACREDHERVLGQMNENSALDSEEHETALKQLDENSEIRALKSERLANKTEENSEPEYCALKSEYRERVVNKLDYKSISDHFKDEERVSSIESEGNIEDYECASVDFENRNCDSSNSVETVNGSDKLDGIIEDREKYEIEETKEPPSEEKDPQRSNSVDDTLISHEYNRIERNKIVQEEERRNGYLSRFEESVQRNRFDDDEEYESNKLHQKSTRFEAWEEIATKKCEDHLSTSKGNEVSNLRGLYEKVNEDRVSNRRDIFDEKLHLHNDTKSSFRENLQDGIRDLPKSLKDRIEESLKKSWSVIRNKNSVEENASISMSSQQEIENRHKYETQGGFGEDQAVDYTKIKDGRKKPSSSNISDHRLHEYPSLEEDILHNEDQSRFKESNPRNEYEARPTVEDNQSEDGDESFEVEDKSRYGPENLAVEDRHQSEEQDELVQNLYEGKSRFEDDHHRNEEAYRAYDKLTEDPIGDKSRFADENTNLERCEDKSRNNAFAGKLDPMKENEDEPINERIEDGPAKEIVEQIGAGTVNRKLSSDISSNKAIANAFENNEESANKDSQMQDFEDNLNGETTASNDVCANEEIEGTYETNEEDRIKSPDIENFRINEVLTEDIRDERNCDNVEDKFDNDNFVNEEIKEGLKDTSEEKIIDNSSSGTEVFEENEEQTAQAKDTYIPKIYESLNTESNQHTMNEDSKTNIEEYFPTTEEEVEDVLDNEIINEEECVADSILAEDSELKSDGSLMTITNEELTVGVNLEKDGFEAVCNNNFGLIGRKLEKSDDQCAAIGDSEVYIELEDVENEEIISNFHYHIVDEETRDQVEETEDDVLFLETRLPSEIPMEETACLFPAGYEEEMYGEAKEAVIIDNLDQAIVNEIEIGGQSEESKEEIPLEQNTTESDEEIPLDPAEETDEEVAYYEHEEVKVEIEESYNVEDIKVDFLPKLVVRLKPEDEMEVSAHFLKMAKKSTRLQSYEEYMKNKKDKKSARRRPKRFMNLHTKTKNPDEEIEDAGRAETIEDIADAINQETCRREEIKKREDSRRREENEHANATTRKRGERRIVQNRRNCCGVETPRATANQYLRIKKKQQMVVQEQSRTGESVDDLMSNMKKGEVLQSQHNMDDCVENSMSKMKKKGEIVQGNQMRSIGDDIKVSMLKMKTDEIAQKGNSIGDDIEDSMLRISKGNQRSLTDDDNVGSMLKINKAIQWNLTDDDNADSLKTKKKLAKVNQRNLIDNIEDSMLKMKKKHGDNVENLVFKKKNEKQNSIDDDIEDSMSKIFMECEPFDSHLRDEEIPKKQGEEIKIGKIERIRMRKNLRTYGKGSANKLKKSEDTSFKNSNNINPEEEIEYANEKESRKPVFQLKIKPNPEEEIVRTRIDLDESKPQEAVSKLKIKSMTVDVEENAKSNSKSKKADCNKSRSIKSKKRPEIVEACNYSSRKLKIVRQREDILKIEESDRVNEAHKTEGNAKMWMEELINSRNEEIPENLNARAVHSSGIEENVSVKEETSVTSRKKTSAERKEYAMEAGTKRDKVEKSKKVQRITLVRKRHSASEPAEELKNGEDGAQGKVEVFSSKHNFSIISRDRKERPKIRTPSARNKKFLNLEENAIREVKKFSDLEENATKQVNEENATKQMKKVSNFEENATKQVRKLSILEENSTKEVKKFADLEETVTKEAKKFSDLEENATTFSSIEENVTTVVKTFAGLVEDVSKEETKEIVALPKTQTPLSGGKSEEIEAPTPPVDKLEEINVDTIAKVQTPPLGELKIAKVKTKGELKIVGKPARCVLKPQSPMTKKRLSLEEYINRKRSCSSESEKSLKNEEESKKQRRNSLEETCVERIEREIEANYTCVKTVRGADPRLRSRAERERDARHDSPKKSVFVVVGNIFNDEEEEILDFEEESSSFWPEINNSCSSTSKSPAKVEVINEQLSDNDQTEPEDEPNDPERRSQSQAPRIEELAKNIDDIFAQTFKNEEELVARYLRGDPLRLDEVNKAKGAIERKRLCSRVKRKDIIDLNDFNLDLGPVRQERGRVKDIINLDELLPIAQAKKSVSEIPKTDFEENEESWSRNSEEVAETKVGIEDQFLTRLKSDFEEGEEIWSRRRSFEDKQNNRRLKTDIGRNSGRETDERESETDSSGRNPSSEPRSRPGATKDSGRNPGNELHDIPAATKEPSEDSPKSPSRPIEIRRRSCNSVIKRLSDFDFFDPSKRPATILRSASSGSLNPEFQEHFSAAKFSNSDEALGRIRDARIAESEESAVESSVRSKIVRKFKSSPHKPLNPVRKNEEDDFQRLRRVPEISSLPSDVLSSPNENNRISKSSFEETAGNPTVIRRCPSEISKSEIKPSISSEISSLKNSASRNVSSLRRTLDLRDKINMGEENSVRGPDDLRNKISAGEEKASDLRYKISLRRLFDPDHKQSRLPKREYAAYFRREERANFSPETPKSPKEEIIASEENTDKKASMLVSSLRFSQIESATDTYPSDLNEELEGFKEEIISTVVNRRVDTEETSKIKVYRRLPKEETLKIKVNRSNSSKHVEDQIEEVPFKLVKTAPNPSKYHKNEEDGDSSRHFKEDRRLSTREERVPLILTDVEDRQRQYTYEERDTNRYFKEDKRISAREERVTLMDTENSIGTSTKHESEEHRGSYPYKHGTEERRVSVTVMDAEYSTVASTKQQFEEEEREGYTYKQGTSRHFKEERVTLMDSENSTGTSTKHEWVKRRGSYKHGTSRHFKEESPVSTQEERVPLMATDVGKIDSYSYKHGTKKERSVSVQEERAPLMVPDVEGRLRGNSVGEESGSFCANRDSAGSSALDESDFQQRTTAKDKCEEDSQQKCEDFKQRTSTKHKCEEESKHENEDWQQCTLTKHKYEEERELGIQENACEEGSKRKCEDSKQHASAEHKCEEECTHPANERSCEVGSLEEHRCAEERRCEEGSKYAAEDRRCEEESKDAIEEHEREEGATHAAEAHRCDEGSKHGTNEFDEKSTKKESSSIRKEEECRPTEEESSSQRPDPVRVQYKSCIVKLNAGVQYKQVISAERALASVSEESGSCSRSSSSNFRVLENITISGKYSARGRYPEVGCGYLSEKTCYRTEEEESARNEDRSSREIITEGRSSRGEFEIKNRCEEIDTSSPEECGSEGVSTDASSLYNFATNPTKNSSLLRLNKITNSSSESLLQAEYRPRDRLQSKPIEGGSSRGILLTPSKDFQCSYKKVRFEDTRRSGEDKFYRNEKRFSETAEDEFGRRRFSNGEMENWRIEETTRNEETLPNLRIRDPCETKDLSTAKVPSLEAWGLREPYMAEELSTAKDTEPSVQSLETRMLRDPCIIEEPTARVADEESDSSVGETNMNSNRVNVIQQSPSSTSRMLRFSEKKESLRALPTPRGVKRKSIDDISKKLMTIRAEEEEDRDLYESVLDPEDLKLHLKKVEVAAAKRAPERRRTARRKRRFRNLHTAESETEDATNYSVIVEAEAHVAGIPKLIIKKRNVCEAVAVGSMDLQPVVRIERDPDLDNLAKKKKK